MFSNGYSEQNQINYHKNSSEHNNITLDSTLYLAYRDVPLLLEKHLFSRNSKRVYRMFDYGCGAGLSTEIFSKIISDAGYIAHVTGMDINHENLSFARQRIPTGNFFSDLSFKNIEKFDLIVCNFVLVENESGDVLKILNAIRSLLNENGMLLVTNCASKAYKRNNKWYTFNNNFPENEPTEMVKGKLKFKEDQRVTVEVNVKENNKGYQFFDFFHSGSAYREAYKEAKLVLVETHKRRVLFKMACHGNQK